MVCLPAFSVSGGLIWLHALMRYLAKSCFPWSVFFANWDKFTFFLLVHFRCLVVFMLIKLD